MRPLTKHLASAAVIALALAPALGFESVKERDAARTKGPRPVRLAAPEAAQHAALVVPSSCTVPTTTTSFGGTTGPLADSTPSPGTTFTANVSGIGTFLWDVDVTTFMPHTYSQDLEVTLQSPAGTVVVLTTDNGQGLNHVFNGTVWDDSATTNAAKQTYTNNVVATPLLPEGRLAAFRGENPNGTWTLKCRDQEDLDTGSITSWSLSIRTLASAPTPTTMSFSSSPGTAIGPNVQTVNAPLAVAGLGTYLREVEVFVAIPHQNATDLDLKLTTPAATILTLTLDNGGSNDDVYNGSLFDVDAPIPVTDYVFANAVVATPLGPEGGLDAALGQNPNGNWTLNVTDDQNGNGGTLASWGLTITTIPTPTPSAPSVFAGTTGPIEDFQSPGVATFTSLVSGAGPYLWDLDVNTTIAHTWCSQLDVTIQSPAGTIVVLTTDNAAVAGGNIDVFNGTRWDDNVNDPATLYPYVSGSVATPLSPEGRLARLRGENPNGIWTLRIADDGVAGGLGTGTGNLTAFSLDVTTVQVVPLEDTLVQFSQPGLPIDPGPANSVSDSITVTTPATSITEVELYVEIFHTYSSDLSVNLQSPAGTIVPVTVEWGLDLNDVFSSTLFDVDAPSPVSDYDYVSNVAVPLLAPEGSFDMFMGENPNGVWTLNVVDGYNLDGGSFDRWDLTIRTCDDPPPVPYCFGDGSGTPCPCTPVPLVGDADKGCPNSFNAGGGKLTASGNSSISADTLVMLCTTINNGGAVVFQGTNDNGGGAGVPFGDGLRCAAGTVRRMKSHPVTTNSHQYPDPMFGDNSISIRGAVVAPGDRWYQGWYRSGLAHCNPTQNYNLTNGVRITWVP